jgi:DNA-binding MarR family transcriptional regulator
MSGQQAQDARQAIATAVVELFGAERRLRGRDQQARDLKSAQMRALFAMEEAEEVTAGQMAKAADLNPASVTAMIDALEEKGIVRRKSDPRDRRVVLVSLTPKGQEIVAQRRVLWDDLWEKHFGGFSERDLRTAVRVIRAMIVQLDEL